MQTRIASALVLPVGTIMSWLTVALTTLGPVALAGEPHYESYYLLSSEYPHNEGTPYANNFQGLTHDDNNWFLTDNYENNNNPEIWKVPVTNDLRNVTDRPEYPGVLKVKLHGDLPPHLTDLGYNHFGDISYYRGYIVVPVECPGPNMDAMFILRASDLKYIGRLIVPDVPERPSRDHCDIPTDPASRSLGWVAVDAAGYLYTSGDCITSIYKYFVNWAEVPSEPPASEYLTNLTFVEGIALLSETATPLTLGHTQGGVFSESGELLYILVGNIHHHDPNEGINVFDTTTWRRVRWSDNQSNPSDPFDYNFDPGRPYGEEPEGITIWDLDDGRAPGITGQLHVGKADYEVDGYDIYIDHFTNVIDVDSSKTVTWANDFAWDGAEIRIQSGNYAEALTITKRLKLSSRGGMVQIGAPH